MDHARSIARLCGAVTIVGGALFCVSSDFTTFPYALLLCMLGSAPAAQLPDRYRASWSKRGGLLALAGALICTLVGIVGQFSSAIVFTSQLYSASGNPIDVTHYPLSYFTDRYGLVTVFLLLGLGLFLLAHATPAERAGQVAQRLLILLAALSLMVYLAGVVNVYLDGDLPGILTAVLWRVFGCGWIILGALHMADPHAQSSKGWLHVA